jgi:heme/copper-type cytochrome/quinol oxidase subunit 2
MARSVVAIAAVLLFAGVDASACAVCTGSSDSPLAQGMTWGILTLLVVVVAVLGGIATFFAYLARRASMVSPEASISPVPNTPKNYA